MKLLQYAYFYGRLQIRALHDLPDARDVTVDFRPPVFIKRHTDPSLEPIVKNSNPQLVNE